MKNIPFKISLLLILLLAFVSVSTAQEAEYKKMHKSWTLHADGSQEYRYYMELQLFTHTAMNRTYGESFIVYNPEFQTLKIHDSYTRQKDGNIIRTPENAFVEVLPRQAADAPAWNHLKEMVVVHTGLELGATIVLDYSIVTQAGYLPELDIFEPIRQTSPVGEYLLTVTVPEGKPLSYALNDQKIRAVKTSSQGKQSFSWKMSNVTASSREPYASGLSGNTLYFAATTYPAMPQALTQLQSAFSSPTNSEVTALYQKICRDKNSNTEKIAAILQYLNEQLASCGLTLQETGNRLRSPEEMIRTAYATEAEKIKLMAALLREAGITHEIMAAFHRNLPATWGTAAAIQALFITAEADGKQYYLSPGQSGRAEDSWLNGYAHYKSITSPAQEVAITVPDVKLDYIYDITLSEEKAETKLSAQTGSAFLPYKAREEQRPTSTQALKKTGDYRLLILPVADNSIVSSFGNLNSRRKEELLLPYLPDEHYRYTIQLPEGMELRTPATTRNINNPVGDLSITITSNGKTAEVVRSLSLKKQLITPTDYSHFRQLILEFGDGVELLFL